MTLIVFYWDFMWHSTIKYMFLNNIWKMCHLFASYTDNLKRKALPTQNSPCFLYTISNIWWQGNRKPPFRLTGGEACVDERPDFHPKTQRPSAWESFPRQVRGQENRPVSSPTNPTRLYSTKPTVATHGLEIKWFLCEPRHTWRGTEIL